MPKNPIQRSPKSSICCTPIGKKKWTCDLGIQFSNSFDGEWCRVTAGSGYVWVVDSEAREFEFGGVGKVQTWQFLSFSLRDFLLRSQNHFFVYLSSGISLKLWISIHILCVLCVFCVMFACACVIYAILCIEWPIWNIICFMQALFIVSWKTVFVLYVLCLCMSFLGCGLYIYWTTLISLNWF